jgi:transposase
MRPPLLVRPLTDTERLALQKGLHSKHAFTLRRCQALLQSSRGRSPERVAHALGCAASSVRNAVHAFHKEGLDCLRPKPCRPKTVRPLLGLERADDLKDLLHKSPRLLGQPTSLWTLALVARVCFTRGWTPRVLSAEAIRLALKRLGIRWRRAKHWITSPDPAYARKKHARDRLIHLALGQSDRVVGYLDEVWWSRLAQPDLHAWAGKDPLHLHERSASKDDPDPKALACYGLLRGDTGEMLLRFVQGRPVSQVTEDFLAWVCEVLAKEGKRALFLIWDNASWHVSGRVRAWIKTHNRGVKKDKAGVRIVVSRLPSKSPWLNPIEPKWVHGKRAIVEAERMLTAQEVKERVCLYYHCPQHEPLQQQKKTEPKTQRKPAPKPQPASKAKTKPKAGARTRPKNQQKVA